MRGKDCLHAHETHGFDVELDADLATTYPLPAQPGYREPVRRPDGTAVRL